MSNHDDQDERETYGEAVDRIKDDVYRTALGWANFLGKTALLEKQEVRDLLQTVAMSGSPTEKQSEWLDDQIDTYANNVADSQQFIPPTYKPSYPPIDMLKLAGDICRPLGVSMPERNASVDAGRGIPVERK
jgi:hypothetical protein